MSPGDAAFTTDRSDPGPELEQFVTVSVAAPAMPGSESDGHGTDTESCEHAGPSELCNGT